MYSRSSRIGCAILAAGTPSMGRRHESVAMTGLPPFWASRSKRVVLARVLSVGRADGASTVSS